MHWKEDVSRESLALAKLAERYGLTDRAKGSLLELIGALARAEHAPTAITDPVAIVKHHIADSLSGLVVAELANARSLVDVGTGAGFPGLVLAAAKPAARVDLLEANARKARQAEQLASSAGIANVKVIACRAEEWGRGEGRGRYEACTSRAVGRLATVCEYAAPLLGPGGTLVVWKGRRDVDEERAARVAATTLGLERRDVLAVGPFAGSRHRHLHVYRKTAATPARFPRRPGMAKKRPLGGRSGRFDGERSPSDR